MKPKWKLCKQIKKSAQIQLQGNRTQNAIIRKPIKKYQSQAALKRELFLHLNTVNVFSTLFQDLTILIRRFKESQKLVAFYLSSKKSNLRKNKEILDLRKRLRKPRSFWVMNRWTYDCWLKIYQTQYGKKTFIWTK